MMKDSTFSTRLIYLGCLSAFLTSLDFNIVNVALPTITDQYSTTISVVSWVTVAYLLTLAAFSPIAGKLSDRVGFGKILTIGLLLFGFSSLACGLAPNIYILIIARGFQGLGGAILFVMGPALFGTFLAPEKRGKAIAWLAITQSLGMCIGPSIGGLITQYLHWSWIFYINLPLCLLAGYLAKSLLSKERNKPIEKTEKKAFDGAGAILIFISMGTILFMLSMVHQWGWKSSNTLLLLFISTVSFTGFIYQEKRTAEPIIRLDYFKNRSFAFTNIALFLIIIITSGVGFILPFNLEEIQELAPGTVGIVLMSYPIMLALTSSLLPRLQKYFSVTVIVGAGALIIMISMVSYALLHGFHDQNSAIALVLLINAGRGVGFGLFYAPTMNLIVGKAKGKEHGMLSAILSMTMSLGALSGIRLFQSVYDTLNSHYSSVQNRPYQLTFLMGALLSFFVIILVLSTHFNSARNKS
ncbi:MFS transporter [bacterium]|nr:MFS transporter [bacterium]